jgi:hypothetical protein
VRAPCPISVETACAVRRYFACWAAAQTRSYGRHRARPLSRLPASALAICAAFTRREKFTLMTMIADTLYWRLAQNLRGFEKCDANTIFRSFVHGKGIVGVRGNEITVVYPKRAHNPILRAVDRRHFPRNIPWLDGAKLFLVFQ